MLRKSSNTTSHTPAKTELLPRRNISLYGARTSSGKGAEGIPATVGMLPDGTVLLDVGDQGEASHAPPLDAPSGVRAVVEERSLVVTCAHGHGLSEPTC